jgi:transmembrane sensor
MPSPEAGAPADDRIRREAAQWMARMDGPDAEMSRLPFERWRAVDPRHRAVYVEMQEIARLATHLGGMPSGQAHLAPHRPSFAAQHWRILAVAAGLLMAVGGGGLSAWLLRDAATSVRTQLATRVGELRTVMLSDGTNVTLDTDSVIEERFTASLRLVRLLRGRARFDVAALAARPFVVEAGDRMILDRGTLFDVRLGREGVRVTLLRGALDVRGPARTSGPAVRLAPGQMFAAAPQAGRTQVSTAPGGGDLWVSGMLSFDGAPLGDVVTEANRYAEHRIILGDPALAARRVTGTFRARPTGALTNVLAATFGLRAERDARGDFVLQPR